MLRKQRNTLGGYFILPHPVYKPAILVRFHPLQQAGLAMSSRYCGWSGQCSVRAVVVSCSGRWFSTVFVKVSVPSCTRTKWTRRGKLCSRTSSARCATASGLSSSSSSSHRPPRSSAPLHTRASYCDVTIDELG